MRGNSALRLQLRRGGRIPPAHAGKISSNLNEFHIRTDHPRVCGENSSIVKFCLAKPGSPPRVQGKLNPFYPLECVRGITPAHAGKTVNRSMWSPSAWDHPRACGENSAKEYIVPCCPGSPPRVRGKLCPELLVEVTRGITPACAGKTKRILGRVLGTGDHPRVCGETVSASSSLGRHG